ncbi:hypothetical protein CLV79_11916 [Limimaricola soesokkakensis]|uniref:Uncharacterized protein n=1 Tax=Limimaricola soesokkakensis TaxID=1343159 RepID=A0A1X7A4B0_9RHOB|nr:hypothetical protein [Limimaricola soesokkakensis]PSK80829.1 hypothetical protein CLV79_11916 [Limimaricola soesokkakensis]SLN69722.1 hypothetical protein LOS8367_03504 [Limimaricola soesokkakensis]
MPLLYAIPPGLDALVSSGQAQLIGAIIKDVSSGQVLGHVQQTQSFAQALTQAGGAAAQTGFSPLGVIGLVQNEQIKASLKELGQGMALLQNLQFANMALTGIGIGVSVAGFAIMKMRLDAIENHLGTLRGEVREIGRLIQEAELRRLFSEIRSALKDLDSVVTRTDCLSLASNLQRQLSTHVSTLSDLLREAMALGKVTVLPMEQLDLIWTLSSAKWLCEEAELRTLFISEDLAHAGDYAARYRDDNIRCLNQLNPDALARLVAAGEKDLADAVSARRNAATRLGRIADGFAGAVTSLSHQHSLAQALIDGGVGGRAFVQAATQETDSPFLLVTPRR